MNETSHLKLLSSMLSIRMVEEAIAREYPKGEIRCPTHLYIGQEAIAAGVSSLLTKEDVMFSSHRSHGHYLAKGGSLRAMIAEMYGRATGCAKGIGGSQHLIDLSVNFWGSAPIVSSTIPVAVGVAFSTAFKKENRIVVCFFGEAATEEGVFFESINFAVLKKLPILFVAENNFYSTNTGLSERQPDGRSRAKVVASMGVNISLEGNGNDVLAVHEKAAAAIAHVRKRLGPAYIEFETYRTMEHCGPFLDPVGYRPEKEKKAWAAKDPVAAFIRYVTKNKTIDSQDIDKMKESIAETIDDAFIFAQKSPYLDPKLVRNFIYAK